MTLANAMLCAAFLLQPLPVVPDSARELRGFSASKVQAQWAWEQKFRAIPDPERIRETMARLSAHPHHVGSAQDKANAEWALGRFREWGFEAGIETFEVLFPTPRERSVELLEPVPFRAGLGEPAIPGDPTTAQGGEQLPPYNAYSRDGDVTGRLVYVNFGRPEDYEQLERMGVGVQGAIVLGMQICPGVREAIERKQWPEAEAQAVRAAGALDGAADLLAEITGMLTS